jgi:hypothetical protein
MIPRPKPQSPTRFIIKALTAARLAVIREYQKLMSKNEHRPTPSQPKNNCRKLSAEISINMQNVNKDKYDINRGRCGSCAI